MVWLSSGRTSSLEVSAFTSTSSPTTPTIQAARSRQLVLEHRPLPLPVWTRTQPQRRHPGANSSRRVIASCHRGRGAQNERSATSAARSRKQPTSLAKCSPATRHFSCSPPHPTTAKRRTSSFSWRCSTATASKASSAMACIRTDISDLMRRLMKEDLLDFEGRPLFPERRAYTVNYPLSAEETRCIRRHGYVQQQMSAANQLAADGSGEASGVARSRFCADHAATPAGLVARSDLSKHLPAPPAAGTHGSTKRRRYSGQPPTAACWT